MEIDQRFITEPPQKTERFVIWHGSHQVDDAEELDSLLRRLGLRVLAELQGLPSRSVQPDLCEETSFFLDYTGQGKLCVAVPQVLQGTKMPVEGILDQSIATLRLSVRASNCLKCAGIQTVAELVRWTPDDLLELPNMGTKTLDELTLMLAALGISSSSPDAPFQSKGSSSPATAPALAEGEFLVETLLTLNQSGVSEQLASRLKLHGIRTLGNLAQCPAGKLRITADLVPEEFVELANALRLRGLRWGMVLPSWHRKHCTELSEAFAREILDSIQNASIWSAQPEVPPPITEVADSLTEELEMLFPKRANQRNRMIVKAYWGLSGEVPLTLEEAAQQYDLTRERVRQIGRPFYDALEEHGSLLPWLEETLTVLKTLCPCLAEEAEAMLEERAIVRERIRAESLLKLARAAKIDHTLVIEGERRLLLDIGMVDALKVALSHAARMVSHWGVAERSEVLMAASCPPSDKFTRLIWDAMGGLVWLDPEETYFWIPTGKNAVENRLLSILRVAPDIALSEAYEGVLRDGRLTRERLPFRIFPALCQRYPWCVVAGERLAATSGLPHGEQDSHDDMIAGFLRETSGIGWRDDLWNRAEAAGIGKPSFDRVLSDSSIIVRHGGSLYGLIGTAAPEIQEDSPIEVREHISSQDSDGTEHEASSAIAGIFVGLDPRSRLFPFQVMAVIWGKSASFENSWSISELQLTRSDVEAIRLWGKFGNLDMRRDIRKTEQIGQVKIRGSQAICLTFLFFCSEVVREDGIEGELWSTFKSYFSTFAQCCTGLHLSV